MPTLNYEIFQTSRKVESFAVNTSPTIYILLQFITYFFIYAVLYPSVIPPYFLMWVSYRLYSYFLLFGIQFVPDLVSDLRMLFTNAWIYLLAMGPQAPWFSLIKWDNKLYLRDHLLYCVQRTQHRSRHLLKTTPVSCCLACFKHLYCSLNIINILAYKKYLILNTWI